MFVAAALALLIPGCGGSSTQLPVPAVVHVVWQDSPSIDKIRLTVSDDYRFRVQSTASRADGDVDVQLSLPPGEVGHLIIEGLDPSGTELSWTMVGAATPETTVRVGGTPTGANIYRTVGGIVHSQPPLNGTTVDLLLNVGGDFEPVPLDAQGAVIVRPSNEFSYAFTNGSVIDYQAPFVISGKAPGSTQVSLRFQSSALAGFGIQVTP